MDKRLYDEKLLSDVIVYNHERYLSFRENLPFNFIPEYEKILSARYNKSSRIRKRLIFLLSHFKCVWFCTFTFSDLYINKSTKTKRNLIKSVINSHDFKYILNIDYGKSTNREHYHCILATNLDFDVNQFFQSHYPCFSLSIQCKTSFNDFKRLSKYINKLVNHCIKSSTSRQRIVYNFKGYDTLFPHSGDSRLAYLRDLISLENDSLLDKAIISGKK